MDFLYNPDSMSEAELKATFVGRENLLRDLLDIIRAQPEGAGVQHTIIIAPRGMGKTATLQRLRYAVLECELGGLWLPVKYPEENYGVIDLADFWLETLRILSVEVSDKKLLEQSRELPQRFQNRGDIADAALTVLKDYSRQCGKRLLLLIENMDELLGLIANGTDAGKLRDALMNDGSFMIAGSGVRFFKQARNYDQPLYNFFQIFDLNQLSFEQARELLLKRAEQEGNTPLYQQLQMNTARLQVLHYFTRGVPRLVLMLYRILAQSDLHAVRQALEKLLDEITPYYKARIEVLPPQERKLLDHIARAAAQTHEGVSPTELSKAMYLPTNHVSTLLKRLVDAGYLRSVPLKGRKACYVLAEPLYSLWHQMRLNPETRNKKLVWLVDFLRDWFDDQQRVAEAKRLYGEFEKSGWNGDGKRAQSVVEHLLLLGQSAMSTATAGEIMRLEVRAYGRLKKQFSSLAKVMDDESPQILADIEASLEQNPQDSHCLVAKGTFLSRVKGEYETALQCFDTALKIDPNDADTWYQRGVSLYFLGRFEDALESRRHAGKLSPAAAEIWNGQGHDLEMLGRFEEACEAYNHALAINPNYIYAKNNLGALFSKLEDNFRSAVIQNEWEAARNYWQNIVLTKDTAADKNIPKRCILFAAELDYLSFAKEILNAAQLEEQLFPLARALDYLQNHNEELLNKLAPEVLGAVNFVIHDLQTTITRNKEAQEAGKRPIASASLSVDDDYIAKRGHLIHKLKAKDTTKRWAYYFVLVLPPDEQAFLKAIEGDGTIDLENYGKLIASCYGEEPNAEVKAFLREKYGFQV